MTVHIDELTTDIAVDETSAASGADAASPWEVAAQHRMNERRAHLIRLRTHSDGFDD